MKRLCLLLFVTVIVAQSVDYPDSNNRYPQNYGQNYNNQNGFNNNNNNRNQQQQPQGGFYNAASQFASQTAQRLYNNTLVNRVVNAGAGLFNSSTGPGIPPVTSGVRVKVQLQNYADQGYKLTDTSVCTCPPGQNYENCIHNSPQRMGYTCYFSFMVIVNSADSQLRYDATPFLRIDSNYGPNPNERNDFQRTFEFITQETPTGITVIVNHMGAVIDAFSGAVNLSNAVVPVDRFSFPIDASTPYGNPISKSGTGSDLQTALTISYTISCSNNSLYGPACNYECNTSSVNSQNAICRDRQTGYYRVCRWQNSIATDCQECPWGIKDDAYCQDENGGLLESHHAGVVSSDYKTATIVLAIVAGVLFILLAIALVISICLQRRNRNAANANEVPPGYTRRNNEHRGGHVGNPESQPLTASNTRTPPVPSPRNQPPSLNSRPGKSSLRTPAYQYPPAAHLGGADSLNETLNSSFAGSQVQASRSAVV